MKKIDLKKELESIEKFRSDYKSKLDEIIPSLLDYCQKLMKRKKVAIRLTGEVDSKGDYLENSQKTNGSMLFYAFPEGIRRIEKTYNDNGLPKTKEVLISQDEFLNWARERFERTEDVYNNLLSYKKKKSKENYFPAEHIL